MEIQQVQHIYIIDMKYIIADIELLKQVSEIDLRARRKSKDGRVMLNEKDIATVFGESLEDKLLIISGIEKTESEALIELNKEVWK